MPNKIKSKRQFRFLQAIKHTKKNKLKGKAKKIPKKIAIKLLKTQKKKYSHLPERVKRKI